MFAVCDALLQAVISWMASVYAAGKGTSSDSISSAAKAAAIGAAYKTVPVREAAAALLEAMVNSLGLADVQRAVQGISDKALAKAASDALAKVTAAGGGAGGMLSAGPSQASGVGARPDTPRMGGSRPGTAASSKGVSRPGSAGGVSRPGTAGSGAGRALATTGSVLSRPGTAAAAAAAAAGAASGADGPLLALDRNKEERAKKVSSLAWRLGLPAAQQCLGLFPAHTYCPQAPISCQLSLRQHPCSILMLWVILCCPCPDSLQEQQV